MLKKVHAAVDAFLDAHVLGAALIGELAGYENGDDLQEYSEGLLKVIRLQVENRCEYYRKMNRIMGLD